MRNILAIILILSFISCEKQKKGKEDISCDWLSPQNYEVIHNNTQIELSVSAIGTIKKVEYFLDGISIGAAITLPYSIKWIPENIDAGMHKLTCIAISETNDEVYDEVEVEMELRLGDNFKGGKIFYLDVSGKHGLIAATSDITDNSSNTFFWGSHSLIGASETDYGKNNTEKMAQASLYSSHAGFFFKNGYSFNGYDDWYIPAQEELKILKENQNMVGGFPTESNIARYWSSTELDENTAFALNFIALMGTNVTKGVYSYRIRPIREF